MANETTSTGRRFAVILLTSFIPVLASAQTVVVGANDPAIDLPAVQAAVNQAGSVLLQGTFDFGTAGRVLINNDVEIGGETDVHGVPVTIINRGEWPFHPPYPPVMPPPATKWPS